jgi:hypothetical protein
LTDRQRLNLVAPPQSVVALVRHPHQLVVRLLRTRTPGQCERISGRRGGVCILDAGECAFEVRCRSAGTAVVACFFQGDRDVGGQRGLSLYPAEQVLMMHEAERVERAVGILVLADPVASGGQDAVVDVDQVAGLGKRLQDERGQEQAALLVLLPKSGKASATSSVGQLPLVTGEHQQL